MSRNYCRLIARMELLIECGKKHDVRNPLFVDIRTVYRDFGIGREFTELMEANDLRWALGLDGYWIWSQ